MKKSTGEIRVMDQTGDTKLVWDTSRQAEVDAAKDLFDKMKKKGYIAYTVAEEGKPGHAISVFDPYAGAIIMRPPITGG